MILDFSFLETLPVDQVRNGMAELVKIAVVADRRVFELLDAHGEELLRTHFGHVDGSPELREIAQQVTYDAIDTMLALEVPNLHELDLDRVIAYGHTWSPTLELAPETPMLHGHAVNVDMALSATLAAERGYIDRADRDRILGADEPARPRARQPVPDADVLAEGTRAITQTRDGLLRAAVPRPIGECFFVNDLEPDELERALVAASRSVRELPGEGEGEGVFVDADRRPLPDAAVPVPSAVRRSTPPGHPGGRPSTTRAATLAGGLDPYVEALHDAGVAGARGAGRAHAASTTGSGGARAGDALRPRRGAAAAASSCG